MKILLLKDVQNLGLKGTVTEVSDGYFRNFLAPKQLATHAAEKQVAHIKAQQAKAVQKLESMKESAESIKEKLEGKSVMIQEKVSDTGKLYAAVTSKEIADAIKDQLKIEIPASKIKAKTIKELGDFDVKIQLHKDIELTINVHVASK